MSKQSSCIAIFSSYSKALFARRILNNTTLNNNQIILLNKDFEDSSSSIKINSFFKQISVQEDTMHSYLSLLHSNFFLLVTKGTYQDIELAYQALEKNDVTSSIHFNEAFHH